MSLLSLRYASQFLEALRTHAPAALQLPEAQRLQAAVARGDLTPAESALALVEIEGLPEYRAARELGVAPSGVYRARARVREAGSRGSA